MRLAEEVNPEMPVLIEHLGSEEEYRENVRYVAERMRKAGIFLQWYLKMCIRQRLTVRMHILFEK